MYINEEINWLKICKRKEFLFLEQVKSGRKYFISFRMNVI